MQAKKNDKGLLESIQELLESIEELLEFFEKLWLPLAPVAAADACRIEHGIVLGSVQVKLVQQQ